MAAYQGLKKWLWKQRTTTRLAYFLQVLVKALTGLTGLFWFRLIMDAMGKPLYGVFVALQAIFSLGGLGDLGIGGAVAIRVGQQLGQDKEDQLQKFLASARPVFLLLALLVSGGVLILSPWIPRWLDLTQVAGSGPMSLVFVTGAASIATVVLFSYFSNLNYACGNVTWPTIPSFFLLQSALLAHWWLARHQQPLWIQLIPYLMIGLTGMCLVRFYVSVSHPSLSRLLPLTFNGQLIRSLFISSFWIYLCSLGNAIYRNTDALVISRGFAKATLTDYTGNYKFCGLAVDVVIMASFVSLPKITQWMASPAAHDQARVRREMQRLNQFQTLLGCGAALAYLAGNNLFIKVWMFHDKDPILAAALPLQLAFALNLGITASGDAGLQLALRSGERGLRIAGGMLGLAGLLNLGLSILAMKMGSLWGIAMATVLAQSATTLGSSLYICRHMKMPWWPWACKTWLLPVAAISLAGWLRMLWPMDSPAHVLLLAGSNALILLLAMWLLGINVKFIKEELQIIRGFSRK